MMKMKVTLIKNSQVTNMNNIHNKRKVLETLIFRVLNENEEIDNLDSIVEVLNGLYYDHFSLRIMNPLI